ncbi:Autophagy protein 16 [Tolypocladium paradoxum]|uniref:Autophagy protein 16 n=1 Tax=Tolypocladium paradoxum TaxID=94208 RepID=A0A2S4KWZ3_9HYPO|nr:Autophagy protein 16 [Tolypocladium paradoxum]
MFPSSNTAVKMPSWRDEYMSSLKDVELKNPVNMELVQACSQMADRISALEAEKAALESHVSSASTANNSKARPGGPAADDAATAQLRVDFVESLRSKGVTETRLRAAEDELARLRTKAKEDGRTSCERSGSCSRQADSSKPNLVPLTPVQQVQDEMITLNLQVAMAEKERDKAKKENKELVDRWMKRMGQEAEAMNLANEPLLDKRR